MLVGAKVTLRSLERNDLPRLHEFKGDVGLHVLADDEPWEPRPFPTLEAFYDEQIKKEPGTTAWFAIEADGKLIGDCGVWNFDNTARSASIGIAIGDREYWGRGYGREAVGLLLDYAFVHRNLNRVWLSVNASNERAVRAYEACGFTEEGRLREHGYSEGRLVTVVMMGVLRREWERDRARPGRGGRRERARRGPEDGGPERPGPAGA